MKLTLGFSPCPNDTFIFDAMIHGRIDTEGLEFELFLGDVEALNRRAFATDLDITKLSYHAYAHLTDAYVLLDAGSALGNNCGPLLIAKTAIINARIPDLKIAIPGKLTTANFLLSLAYPKATHKIELLFSEIEEAVLNGTVDAGLIIHENRFTYAEKGLVKLIDLGEFWEQTTGMPIPLGGIAIKRSLPAEIITKVNRIIRRSVEYAWANPAASEAFVAEHAQEMDPAVRRQHIDLYVNRFSANLGTQGRDAVQYLFKIAQQEGIIPPQKQALFVHD
ncbi:MAG: 1,4-dihydroxy-6-naphthoate synthase [Haliscomenobacter sp.]|nr:1,4-dihydroxy-6-naphthoate synthase [Haliscomenobacter sp.]MBK9489668.1 1,4-dihydroxy-6-naphthoate synthase [Haliscomenobacter sp.]